MKNILIVTVIVVLLGGGAYFFLKGRNQTTNAPIGGTNVTTEPNTILIKNFSFDPGTLKVKTGTTVTWVNEDTASHTVKSDTFTSGNLGQGEKFTFTFSAPGTYNYSCGIHPTMTGQIVVE